MTAARRRRCSWCNQLTASYRRTESRDGYECRWEERCGAKKNGNWGKLTRLGIAKVLRAVHTHDWNLTKTAEDLGVEPPPLRNFLDARAPKTMARMRREGFVRRDWASRDVFKRRYALTDPDAIRRQLRLHDGNRNAAAKALEVAWITLVTAVDRLCPGEFPVKPKAPKALVRIAKQDPARHPWRLSIAASIAETQARRRVA